ncbi:MAG: PhoH family protein [Actinomycetota bacterium]|nr:PhoH family protein [Actinomycetota bacterium]
MRESRSIVVLDTSALIADPEAPTAYGAHPVVLPLVVIEELDHLKGRTDQVGWAARSVLRHIEHLRSTNGGDLRTAVPTVGGGTFRVELNGLRLDALAEHGLDPSRNDNRILAAALGLAGDGSRGDVTVTVVSNDTALRLKAAQLGLRAAEHARVSADGEPVPSSAVVEASSALIDRLYSSPGGVLLDDLAVDEEHLVDAVVTNGLAVVRCGNQSALVRRRADRLALVPSEEAWGLRPRSKEQRHALDLLLDPDVSVVALDGAAGTGKTVLAIAAGLEQVLEPANARYAKLSVFRPIIPVGRADVGFLPGDLEEKLDPWMAAVTDALVSLTSSRSEGDARALVEELRARRQLTMETVTFLRGRTLVGSYVLVDEAQNLEPSTLKTILTRVGEGTKIVFTGDTTQIDHAYLSERTNALRMLIESFGGQSCFGHTRLVTCERSEVADLAAKLL